MPCFLFGMRKNMSILRIAGIDIRLHLSWWIILILLSWSLSSSFFPALLPDKSMATYWSMGIIAAILLFVSVLLHELSHAFVAKAKKIRVESITLFFFGGVASINDEDMKPGTEFIMALAGPLFSLLLGGVFYAIHTFNGNEIITAVSAYLYQINLIVAIFNIVPGFPLDGGRALRAVLYKYYQDLTKATRIASLTGKFFAGALVVLGIAGLFTGLANGLWFMLLGGFLYFLAGAGYEQVVVRETLRRFLVKSIMRKKHEAIDPEMKWSDFLQEYAAAEEEVYVVENRLFKGLLDLRRIEAMPREMQEITTVQQLAVPLAEIKSVTEKDTLYTVFTRCQEQGLEVLPVIDKNKMIGLVSKAAVMQQLMREIKFGARKGKG